MNKLIPGLFMLAAGFSVTAGAQLNPPCGEPQALGVGLISVHALKYKPVKAARKHFDQGMRAIHKGLSSEALEHFTEAARLDAGYAEAHAEIGVLLAQSGQVILALERFRRAVEIEPDADYLQFNMAWALVVLHRPAEAEVFARRTLRLSPILVDAHYLLGLALVMQDKLTAETAASLRLAAPRNPQAREILTWVEGQLSAAERIPR